MIEFNPGELYFQIESGVEQKIANFAPQLIKRQIPIQHSVFYSQLSMLFVASVDAQGQPWASVVSGCPGFITMHNEKNIIINANLIIGDPLINNRQTNRHLGFLGLEFETRRRNRFSGAIQSISKNEMNITVDLAFGNCPKYIQTRKMNNFRVNPKCEYSTIQRISSFSDDIIGLISASDTFFIASYYPHDNYQGADISHRGGKPGFVSVENDKTLSFVDFSGNDIFMTMGNLKCNPVAGLLFINFETGDILQLACQTEIIISNSKNIKRKVRLTLQYGWFIPAALLIESELLEYSPFLK